MQRGPVIDVNGVKPTLPETWGWGCYPAGYDRVVHGPYDPARYYGPKDLSFGEVKLNELPAWIGRRNKSPQSMMQMLSRWQFRWQDKFRDPKKAGVAWWFQFVFMVSTASYISLYSHLKHHKNYKYHW